MHIDAGRLNKRISFLRHTAERDADGYRGGDAPALVRSCWAQFSQTSGTEVIRAGGEFGEAKVRFLTRAHPSLNDRRLVIVYGGEEYEIEYINSYGDEGNYMEFWCSRRTMEGAV